MGGNGSKNAPKARNAGPPYLDPPRSVRTDHPRAAAARPVPSSPESRRAKHLARVLPCFQRPVMAVKIVLGFVLKMAVYWPWLTRDLFFCQSLEQSTLKR